jgi:Flp pilus assembly protein CpaB
VSRRARALVFLAAALLCALLAATVAGRYRSRVEAQYGPLRPVVVSVAELPEGQAIGPEQAGAALAVRRIPASFIRLVP